MTKSATGRAAALLFVAALTLALGCASDKDAPVYDTAANPLGLPAQACDLLEAIEAGRLVHYDVITEAFGRLYLENQELLENEHWKAIVTRLGDKFHSRADELIKSGVRSYSQAAGFYMLASFSAPDDTELAKTATLFTAWKEMMEKIDSDYIPSPTSVELADRLDFLRCFVFGDSLEQAFAQQFLIHQMLDSMMSLPVGIDPASLSRPDAALLTYLGIIDGKAAGVWPSTAHLISAPFWARRLVAVGPERVRVELYFTTSEPISADFRIALALSSVTEHPIMPQEEDLEYSHISPIQSSEGWSLGQIRVASTIIPFADTAAWIRFILLGSGPTVVTKQPLPVERFGQR